MDDNTMAAAVLGLGVFVFILAGAWFILRAIADWHIFKKAGIPGWHALIPFLNTYDEYALSWNGTFGLIAVALAVAAMMMPSGDDVNSAVTAFSGLLGLVSLIFTAMQSGKLARAFGKGTGFAVGLFFLQNIFRLILAFGDAEYQGPQN